MKKIIVNENMEFATMEEVAEYISENTDYEEYDEDLDNCYGEVKIGCCTFYPSEILRECDPIAYRCGFDDFKSFVYDDVLCDLERGEVIIRDYDIKYVEEDE